MKEMVKSHIRGKVSHKALLGGERTTLERPAYFSAQVRHMRRWEESEQRAKWHTYMGAMMT